MRDDAIGRHRDSAEGLIQSAVDMDEGSLPSTGFSIEEAVANVGIEAIHLIWAEDELHKQLPELQTHIENYPHGVLVSLLNYMVDHWVAEGVVTRESALKDYGLV